MHGGGISTYCYHTANMLAEKGHSVTIFIPDEKTKDYTIEEQNSIRIIRFSTNRKKMQNHLGFVPNMAYEFASITQHIIQKEGKPDCIESQEYLAISYYVMQFKLLQYPEFSNVPIILTLHSPAFLYLYYNREGIYSFPNYWTCEMEKSCIQCADWIIAPSQYIVEEIKKHASINEAKISVIHNPYRSPDSINPDQKISRNKIVFFGKLSPQKGVFELFSYMKDLWDKGFPQPLIVIGGADKVYYPEMKTMGQIAQNKYSNYIQKGLLQFVGKIIPEKKNEYLKDAHVILIPSINDNLPYTSVEAMSMGKVVLASIQGGQREIIEDGANGFLFDHEQPENFAEKLNYILSLNDSTLKNIGEAAVQKILTEFGYESVYAQKINIIDNACHQIKPLHTFPFIRPLNVSVDYDKAYKHGELLSIVIPYFNMGKYIGDCINSILQSSYKNIEILIINDGSTEQQSIAALKQFEEHQSVKIIHKNNEGLADTRNFGASLAKGRFLAFLDADDKVHKDYYNKAIKILEQYENVFFVGSWVQYFGTSNKIWPTWNPEPPYILLHNSVNSSALIYKKEGFLKAGLFDKKVDYGIEDYESVINMLELGHGGIIIPECLFFYRVRKDSMYRLLTHYKILYSSQYIARKHADFYSKFAPEIFNLLNANGPSFSYDNPSFEIQVTSKNAYPKNFLNKIKIFAKRNPGFKKILLRIASFTKMR